MASVVLQGVTKQFGPKVVLEGVSLELRTGETVGLVGANGVGKTTLFRVITGDEAPEVGTVTSSRGLEVGLLAQEPQLDSGRSVHEEVGRASEHLLALEGGLLELSQRMAEERFEAELPDLMARYDRLSARFEAAGGYGFQTRMNEIMGGLGFTAADQQLPVSALSGGQRCRVALAKLLLQERQLLLLDEPTNHLDIEATRWLERFLAGHRGGAVIVSHDRYLLDRLVTKIIEIDGGRVTVYPGNYSTYVQAKQVRRLTAERRYAKDREFIEKERAFIAKHISRQRSKEARGRRTRLERRIRAGEFILEAPGRQRSVPIKFQEVSVKSHMPVLRCEGLGKRYGDKVLFADLSLQVSPGERLGITGPNGTGKTTLLKIILEEVTPDAGSAALTTSLGLGYYDQEHAGLDRSRSVLEEVGEVREDLSETQLRSFLGAFLFSGDEVFKPIGQLSGGEQSRVRLAKLVLSGPQVLILDEPTNHLDIPSREALESALSGFDGTIIVVSHDRYFLDRVADRLLVLEKGGHELFDGNYSYYAKQVEARRLARERDTGAGAKGRRGRRLEPRRPTAGREPTPYAGLTLEEIEERIMAKEQELAAIHGRFGDQSVYRDQERARVLQTELEATTEELAALNRAWEQRIDGAEA